MTSRPASHALAASLVVFALGCNGDTTGDASTGGAASTGSSGDTPTTGGDESTTATPTTGGPGETGMTGDGTSGTGDTAPTTGADPTTEASSSTGDTGGVELGPPVLRINVGGPAVDDFLADDGPESAYRASPDTELVAVDAATPDASVPPELPLAVLATARVEPPELTGGTGQLRYAIPVEPGAYQLRLHFAGPSQGPDTRVAELRVDDVTVIPEIDISALTDGGAAATVTVAIEADDWLDLELVRRPGSGMPLLAAIELFGAGALRDGPAGVVRHVSPAGGGTGESLADAASLGQLPALIAASAPGDEVWIHAGDYMTGGELNITAGGSADAPVVIRGVGADWHDAGRPRFLGDRASPWVPDGEVGGTVFRLAAGADHLRFVNLGFVDQGNGCIRVAAPIAGLQLENIVASNVHRLLEDYIGGNAMHATISGLVMKDIAVRGYARAVARLEYDSNAVRIEDVFGDSEAQQYESFSTGVTLAGTVHDVVLRRAVMLNNQQLEVDGYWNADGFSTERDNSAITFEDTFAAGNTDGGYDLKSTSTTLTRAVAADNKRNFRIWGEATLNGCVGLDPHKRGGSGTQAQLHMNPQGDAVLTDCRMIDADPDTIVFDLDDDGAAKVVGGCVERDPNSTYQTVEPAASLMLEGVADGCG